MMMKKAGLTILAIGLTSVSVMAEAANLVLNNNTDNFITSFLNDSVCSSILGNAGVTKPHEQNHVVPASTVGLACMINPQACKADIYASNNCTGEKIATIILNTATGTVNSLTMHSNAYQIANAGFNFTLNKV